MSSIHNRDSQPKFSNVTEPSGPDSSESKVSSVGERVLGLIGKAAIAPTRLLKPLHDTLGVKPISGKGTRAGSIGHVLRKVAFGAVSIPIVLATCVTCFICLPLYGVGRAGQRIWNRFHRESSLKSQETDDDETSSTVSVDDDVDPLLRELDLERKQDPALSIMNDPTFQEAAQVSEILSQPLRRTETFPQIKAELDQLEEEVKEQQAYQSPSLSHQHPLSRGETHARAPLSTRKFSCLPLDAQRKQKVAAQQEARKKLQEAYEARIIKMYFKQFCEILGKQRQKKDLAGIKRGLGLKDPNANAVIQVLIKHYKKMNPRQSS